MTSSARLDGKRSQLGELWLGVQRQRALIALFDLGRQKTYGLRAARVYAFGVFVSYAIAIGFAGGAGQGRVVHDFVTAALVALSWVVGALATLGAAQALTQHTERDALTALAVQRGFGPRALFSARTLAAAQRIARLVALPALLLIAIGVLRGASAPWALAAVPAAIVYACIFGLTLAALAQLSAELAPSHPRWLVLGLVLVPLLIAQVFAEFPNLPHLFSWLLTRLFTCAAGCT